MDTDLKMNNNTKIDHIVNKPQTKSKKEQTLSEWLLHKLRVTVVTIWCLTQHILYFPEYATLFLVLHPLRWVYPKLYYSIDRFFYSNFIGLFAQYPSHNGHRIIEYGAEIGQYTTKRCVLTPNHQDFSDVPIIFAVLSKYKVFRDFMWIMDKVLQFTHFGMCSTFHGDCFIQQGTGTGSKIFASTREEQMKMLSDHLRDKYYKLDRRWIALFPEGGLLRKRRAKSQSYAKRNDLPVLEHVSLPRLGGLEVIMTEMTEERYGKGKGLEYVIDVTIGHPENKTLSLPGFMLGTQGPKEIHVYYRVIPVSEIPRESNEKLTNWLYGLYVEKERLLTYFYKNGEFPLENGFKKSPPRTGVDNIFISFITMQGLFVSLSCVILYGYYILWCYFMA